MRPAHCRLLLPTLLTVATLPGCDGGRSSPTSPRPTAISLRWEGTWAHVSASPEGGCLAEALNRQFSGRSIAIGADSGNSPESSLFYLTLWDPEDELGYSHTSFNGTIDRENQVYLQGPGGANHEYLFARLDLSGCDASDLYAHGATLTGAIAGEGASFAGEVRERYLDGAREFEIVSRFELRRASGGA